MYLSFYGLKENPFQISTNPHFLWLGEKHQEAFASLRYGILGNKGFLLLTGGVGTGKTTLINALLASLDKDVVAMTIPDPGIEQIDLFYLIANGFNLQADFQTKGKFLVIFSQFLHAMHEKGKKVLLIIDEAQRLSPSVLEEIRLLSNIEKPDTKLINIFFVGQMEFNAILLRQENRALRQRIMVNYHIPPLSLTETGAYLDHRLKVAGSLQSLFSREAVQQIHLFSRGYPRLINVIADRALLTGFVSEEPKIGAKIVLECARELKIPEPRRTVRKPKSTLVPPIEDEFEEQEEQEGQMAAVEPDVQPPAAVKEPEGRPQPVAVEDDKHGSAAGEPEEKGQSRTLPFLVVLLALVVGVFSWFTPPWAQRAMDVVQQRWVPFVEKQLSSHFQAPVPAMTPPAMKAKKAGKVKPVASLPARTTPAAEVAATARDKREVSVAQGGGSAGHAATAVGEEKARIDKGTKTIAEKADSPTKEESRKIQAGQDVKTAEAKIAGKGETPTSATDAVFPDRPLVIGFDYDSNNLSTYGIFMLNQLAKEVQSRPYSKMIIRGYSDALGSDNYNENLSLFRANIVKSYLMAKGVKSDTMVTLGLGAKNPLGSNDTAEGRRKNRRVEIEIQP